MNDDNDVLIHELREAVDPILSKMDEDYEKERAVLLLCGVDEIDDNGNSMGADTFIDTFGDVGILQEALFAGLMRQIELGKPDLFEAIREVIHEIENDTGLEDGDSLLIPENRTLH